jgi:hypothetical protein
MHPIPPLPSILLIPKVLLLVKQIRPTTSQIDDLRTPVPVFLESRTLKAVERIRDAFAAAHDALILVVTEGAFVADTHQSGGPHVGVAHGAFAVAFVAEAPYRDAGGFAAHDEVGVVAGHGDGGSRVGRSR